MSVRLKLDLCGVKVSLKQWNKFAHEDRELLVTKSCRTPEQVVLYKQYLLGVIERCGFGSAESLPIDPNPEWADPAKMPERIIRNSAELGLAPPSTQQWQALSLLQRFALFKLTRPGHSNENFVPALREFGIQP
jgi:hypothetical protein